MSRDLAERKVAGWEKDIEPATLRLGLWVSRPADSLSWEIENVQAVRDLLFDVENDLPAAFLLQQLFGAIKVHKDWPKIREEVIDRVAEKIAEERGRKEEP